MLYVLLYYSVWTDVTTMYGQELLGTVMTSIGQYCLGNDHYLYIVMTVCWSNNWIYRLDVFALRTNCLDTNAYCFAMSEIRTKRKVSAILM